MTRAGAGLALVLVLLAAPACGAGLGVQVFDAKGAPLENAVVFAEPVSGGAPLRPRKVEIEQKDREFRPLVTVVQTGTAINFPNNDTVRHHVYSFSKAKKFELRLYSGVPANPVLFDKPGTVVLGCNIHDQMVAYVRVVDTPWFGRTDKEGRVRIDGVPEGAYRLKTWAVESADQEVANEQAVTVKADLTMATVRLGVAAGKAN